MANQQGTGRHGHKDTQEPHEHRSGGQQGGSGSEQSGRGSSSSSSRGSKSSHSQQSQSGGSSGQQGGSGDSSLREREYKDAQGNTHHHTKTYMEQHKGEGGKGR